MSKEKGIREAYEKMLDVLERWLNEPIAYDLKLAKAEAEYRRRLEHRPEAPAGFKADR